MIPTWSLGTWLKIASAALSALVIAWGVNTWNSLKSKLASAEKALGEKDRKIGELNQEVQDAAADLDKAKTVFDANLADARNQAQLANNERNAARRRAADFQRIADNARNAPVSDDGPIAPVLVRSLNDVAGLLKPRLEPDDVAMADPRGAGGAPDRQEPLRG